MFALLDQLLENPCTSSKLVREQLGVSAPTAYSLVARFERLGMLKETTGRSRNQEYCAAQLVEVIDTIVRLRPDEPNR